jgi:hypothetical protein
MMELLSDAKGARTMGSVSRKMEDMIKAITLIGFILLVAYAVSVAE